MSRLMKVRAQLIDKVTKLPIQDIDVLTSTDCVQFPDGETLEEKWNRGDLKGDPGEDGDDGVSATLSIGEVLTVDSNSLAAVENVGTMSAAILNFKIPKGETGEPGTSVKILGRFETYEDLIAVYPEGSDIDGGVMVGPEGGPDVYYYWDRMALKWTSAGSITGPKGDKGDPATIVISSVNTVESDMEASVTNVGTDTDVRLVFNIPRGVPGETPEIIIDPDLSIESENPAANKAIVEEFNNVKSDIAQLLVQHLDDFKKIANQIDSSGTYENVSDMFKLI